MFHVKQKSTTIVKNGIVSRETYKNQAVAPLPAKFLYKRKLIEYDPHICHHEYENVRRLLAPKGKNGACRRGARPLNSETVQGKPLICDEFDL